MTWSDINKFGRVATLISSDTRLEIHCIPYIYVLEGVWKYFTTVSPQMAHLYTMKTAEKYYKNI